VRKIQWDYVAVLIVSGLLLYFDKIDFIYVAVFFVFIAVILIIQLFFEHLQRRKNGKSTD
jgi:hypothetical protein